MKLPGAVVGSVVCSLALTATVLLMSGRRPGVAIPDVRPEIIRTHLEFLADDAQEGRMTGTPGFDRAADYVTAQFKRLGLQPAFGGRFEQPLALRHTKAVGDDSSITFRRGQQEHRLSFGDDFVASGDMHRESASVSAPIVFVGDGISAPDEGHDDYADVDVHGRIVAMVLRRTPGLEGARASYFGNIDVRIAHAVEHGATGFLMLGSDPDYPWERNQQLAFQGLTSTTGSAGDPMEPPQPIAVAVLQYAAAEQLFELASLDFADTLSAHRDGQLPSMELPVNADIEIRSRHSTLDSANIGAVLPGSDPELRHEFVVFSAHLDHVGRGIPVNGDDIYNGAIDNASGVSEMLAMIEAITKLPDRPRRSLLFLATAGEEVGNLGAKHFVAQPPMPLRDIAALVNVDGPTLMYRP